MWVSSLKHGNRWIDYAKLSINGNECMNVCAHGALKWTAILSRVPVLHIPDIFSGSTATVTRIRLLLKDDYLLIVFGLIYRWMYLRQLLLGPCYNPGVFKCQGERFSVATLGILPSSPPFWGGVVVCKVWSLHNCAVCMLHVWYLWITSKKKRNRSCFVLAVCYYSYPTTAVHIPRASSALLYVQV